MQNWSGYDQMPCNTESTKKQTQHASVSEQQTLSESDTDEESV